MPLCILRIAATATCFLLITLCRASQADNICSAWNANSENAENLIVGRITIEAGNVFDTQLSDEQRRIHRLTNRLHIATRSSVIKSQLLFESGDLFELRLLQETERLLRTNRFIREATVSATEVCGQQVNIQVKTADHWTLTPSFSYKQAGGETEWTAEIQELNLLGLGKAIKIANKHDPDTNEWLFQYRDDNVLGSRYRLGLEQQTLNGRDSRRLVYQLPFFSEDSQRAWSIELADNRELSQYESVDQRPALWLSEEADFLYRHKFDTATGFIRAGAGVRIESERFTVDGINRPETDDIEYDYRYPYLSFQYLNPQFTKKENLYSIGRTEDLSIGTRLLLETGIISTVLGNDENLLQLRMGVRQGWQLRESLIGAVSVGMTEYLNAGRRRANFQIDAFKIISDRSLLQWSLRARHRQRYSQDRDYSLGGESGLKAYPNSFQRGNRMIVAATEYRYILDWYPLSLFRLALSGFHEIGSAWSRDVPRDWLQNAGFGLAVSPTRTSTHDLFRFDIAVPLTDHDGVRDYQIYVGTQIRY